VTKQIEAAIAKFPLAEQRFPAQIPANGFETADVKPHSRSDWPSWWI